MKKIGLLKFKGNKMTNKMIDADAFDKLVEWVNEKSKNNRDTLQHDTPYDINSDWLKNVINFVSTPAPEPQETIDNDWNHDLSLLEDYDEPYLISNGCRIAWGEGFGDNAVYHPTGDFMAFDEEYFRQSVKMWKPL